MLRNIANIKWELYLVYSNPCNCFVGSPPHLVRFQMICGVGRWGLQVMQTLAKERNSLECIILTSVPQSKLTTQEYGKGIDGAQHESVTGPAIC